MLLSILKVTKQPAVLVSTKGSAIEADRSKGLLKPEWQPHPNLEGWVRGGPASTSPAASLPTGGYWDWPQGSPAGPRGRASVFTLSGHAIAGATPEVLGHVAVLDPGTIGRP